MYIAYSNSNDNSMNHTFQYISNPRTMKPNRSQMPKKTVRLLVSVIVLTLVFSFGAFVQAYAGNADTTKSNNSTPISESSINSDSSANKGHSPVKIVVNAGDTLWDIASLHVSKGQNIRSYIANLKKLNALSSSFISEGDVLLLP
jgi:LysM repeat protein